MAKLIKSSTKLKHIPPKPPVWLCKCCWDATAVYINVAARDESIAWDKAWRQVSRMFGGDSCLKVQVIRRVE